MNKQEYLEELKRQLKSLPATEVQEIMSDYVEHFDMALAAGKTEQATCDSLGHPRIVAQGYMVSSLMTEAKESKSVVNQARLTFRILFMIFVLAPLNFFLLLGPFIILLGLVIAGWSTPIATGAASVAGFWVLISTGVSFAFGSLPGLSLLFMLLGGIGLSVLGGIIMLFISKMAAQIVLGYLRWNINFVTARHR